MADIDSEATQFQSAQRFRQCVRIRDRGRKTLQIGMVVFVNGEDERDAALLGHPPPPPHAYSGLN